MRALEAFSKRQSAELEIIEPEIEIDEPEIEDVVEEVEEIVEEKKGGVQQLRTQALRKKKATFLKKVKESDAMAAAEAEAKAKAKSKTQKQPKTPNVEVEAEVVLADEPVVVEEENVIKKKGNLKSAAEIAMERTAPVAEEVVEVAEPVVVEKKGNLKSSVEKAMEQTNSIAEEYNEHKLKKEDIESAKTLDELLAHVDASDGLQGTQDYFDKDQLRMIIEEVRDGRLDFNYITRSQGLRQKVIDLLQNPAPETEPTPESGPKANFESVFELDDEEEEVVVENNEGSGTVEEALPESTELLEEIKNTETEIVAKRESLVDVHKQSKLLEQEYSRQPKKFLYQAFGWGLDKRNKALEGFEAVRLDYQSKFDVLVNLKTEQRFEEISQLHANSSERKKYTTLEFSDLQPYLQNKTGINEALIEEMSKYDDITLSMLKESKIFKKEEIQSILSNVILKRIKDEVTKELKESEDAQIQELLKK